MVVAPRELVEVSLQPAVGDLLVVPTDAGLEVPKEALDGVRVGVTDDVLARRVAHAVVAGEVAAEAVVCGPLVGVDDRRRFEPLHDLIVEVRPTARRYDGRLDPPATFDRSEYRCSTTFAQLVGFRTGV